MHIRIVSPSGAIDPAYIDGAAARLRSWGHEVSESAHCRGQYGRFSGTVDERMGDLQQAIDDPVVDAILCSRGGYGLAQYVDKLDLALLGQKIVIGFSDITALHNALGIFGYPSVHGIMAKHITELNDSSEALMRLRQVLQMRTQSGYSLECEPHRFNRTGSTRGIIRGGNLSVLYGLRGTTYDLPIDRPFGMPFEQPDLFPTILFIEDIGERAYHIDRMMQSLRIGGILERISGLIVGQLTNCDDDPLMNASTQEIIAQVVSPYSYPVCFNFPAGHVAHNLPLWLNCMANLTVDEAGVRIEYL